MKRATVIEITSLPGHEYRAIHLRTACCDWLWLGCYTNIEGALFRVELRPYREAGRPKRISWLLQPREGSVSYEFLHCPGCGEALPREGVDAVNP